MDSLAILPMAFVMIAGPQIISAIFLATSDNWRGNSSAYVAGAAVSITFFVTIAYFATRFLRGSGDESGERAMGDAIFIVVLILLLYLVVRTYVKRNQTEPPKWMGKLEAATPSFSFKLGAALLGVFPTDIITSAAVGSHLAQADSPWWQCLPFILLTLFFLALPALLLVLFGKRAEEFLPKAREWMNTNSWVVSEVVLVFFIAITINSLAG